LELSIKNTFLHVDEIPTHTLSRSVSAPELRSAFPEVGVSVRRFTISESATGAPDASVFHPIVSLSSSAETVALEHERGECRPCAYFAVKSDGCRLESGCQFCHLCTSDDLKRRKKERVKAIKAGAKRRVEM